MVVAGSSFDAAELLGFGGLTSLVVVLSFIAFVVVAGKDTREGAEPRGQAVYLHLMLLISLFLGMLAATAIVASLSQLIGTNTAAPLFPFGTTGSTGSGATGVTGFGATTGSGGIFGSNGALHIQLTPASLHPVGDAAARGAVAGGIVLVVAALIFVTHWRQARRFREDAVLRLSNAGRVLQAYLNTATFVAVLILVVTASLAGYAVFEAAAPGVAATSGHVPPLRGLIPLLFFTGANLLIIDRHWRAMRWLRGTPPPAAGTPSEPPSSAPPPEPPAWAGPQEA